MRHQSFYAFSPVLQRRSLCRFRSTIRCIASLQLALGAVLLGLAAMFVAEPVARRLPGLRVSRWVRRLPFWLLVVGLVASLGWAAWQRVRRGQVAAHTAPAVFAVLFALASLGPWSISEVSEASQLARLEAELKEAGVSGEFAVTPEEVGRAQMGHEACESIHSRLRYLSRHHGEEAVSRLVSQSASASWKLRCWDRR